MEWESGKKHFSLSDRIRITDLDDGEESHGDRIPLLKSGEVESGVLEKVGSGHRATEKSKQKKTSDFT